ncbi:MAG: EF-P 5-aminopentanol modification-associated protein YfmH [Acutalibacteraceae bacterium]
MNFTEINNKRLGEKYYRIHHSSGLNIIVCPKEGFNSVYATIATKFGSINSQFIHNGNRVHVPDGTAHYLEHKLFESEDGDAFSKYAKTGASANAYTSFDVTCYLFSCTDKFEESLEILIDLIQSPYFTPETVAKEQGIIGQEIKMYEDDPNWKVMMNLLQAMYKNHPINIDIAGTVDTIAQITPETLYECYNSYYNLNNMVMCIAGNVTPEQVLEIAGKKLKKAEKCDTQSVFSDEPYEVVKNYTEQILPVAVPMFEMGFKENAPKTCVTTKELICTNILLTAFAAESSALYRKLIDEKLINSTFDSEYLEGSGYRAVIFSGESRNPKKAAEFILDAVKELHENGISKEDFEIAKRSVYGKLISGFDSPSSIASGIINAEFSGREIFESVDVFSEITLDDVNNRLKAELDPENYSLSVVKSMEE